MASKLEYLKRYMSGPDTDDAGKKKKKKSKKKEKVPTVGSRMKIVDYDVRLSDLKKDDDDPEAFAKLETKEELPQVAGLVDERPEDVRMEEEIETGRWKRLTETDQRKRRHDSDGSQSPVRRKRHDSSPTSRKRHDSDGSPVRRRHDSDASPVRRRHDSDGSPVRRRHDSDASPVRKRHDSDTSPVRKRHDSDTSPARRRHDSSDASPKRHRDDSDCSPDRRKETSPARRRKRHDSSDASPERKRHASDNSPVRRRNDSDNVRRRRHDSDASPPRANSASSPVRRRRKDSSDASPVRRKRKDSSDASPVRRRRKDSSDASPVRRKRRDSDESPPRKRNDDSDESPPRLKDDLMKTTLDGKKAGLQDAKGLKKELESIREKERRMFDKMSNDLSGRGAETKVRGRLKEKQLEEERKKKENEITDKVKEKYSRWSKGVRQAEETQARISQDLYEMDKPLARSKDDSDLDAHLKQIEHQEDPMLEYIRKKKEKKHSTGSRLPVYQGPQPPPNRFGIRPGYRWDGADRSNGFERRLFEQRSKKLAVADEAYAWSTEDM